ncbi:MAG: hypothetical protein ACNA7Z_02790 [Dethiobacteria bacterium]|nr:hypothetical protein [Bacillota bacterium]
MNDRLARLKQVVFVKLVLTIFIWGLPSLLAPPVLLELFDIPTADLTFLRIFGVALIAMSVAYWFAYKDPLRNLAVIWMLIVDNGLAALVIVVLGLTLGVGWYLWLTAVIAFLFFLAFLVLVPKSDLYRQPV